MSVPTLLELLLQEQGELSAVDRFSDWHESHSIAAATYQALMPATAIKSGQQYAFEVDLDACSGCKACVVACHTLNGLEESETWRKVGSLASHNATSLPVVQHVTTACHHCVEPGCLNGCPVQAYEKDPVTGIVRHLDDQCFGCKYCTMMCPYEVPQYSTTLGIVRKCDMCSQRLSIGEAPACVQACPNQAIRIVIVDASNVIAGSQAVVQTVSQQHPSVLSASLVATAPLSHITKPTTRYLSKHPVDTRTNLFSTESIVDKAHEGHLPLVFMIVLTQTSVGIWIVLALLTVSAAKTVGAEGASTFHPFAAAFATTIGIIGVHAALLHLGRPWLAFRAFLGWRTSWLSREAILFGAYMGIASVATGVQILLPEQSLLLMATAFGAAISGLLAVLCTSMIYIATRRELWIQSRTGVDFTLSMIGLGLVGAFACVNRFPSELLATGVLVSMTASFAKILDYGRGRVAVNAWDDFSARSGRILRTELYKAWVALWTLQGVSLVLALGVYALPRISNASVLPFVILAICVVAQAFHRWLYFASVVYRRMPGAST